MTLAPATDPSRAARLRRRVAQITPDQAGAVPDERASSLP
jgi:hypothetical protein